MPKQMSQTVIVLACNLGCVVLVTPEQAVGTQLLAAEHKRLQRGAMSEDRELRVRRGCVRRRREAQVRRRLDE